MMLMMIIRIGYSSACMKDESQIRVPNRGFSGSVPIYW